MTGSELDRVDSFIESAYERLEAAKMMLENGYHKDSINRSYYAMANMTIAALMLKDVHVKTHKGMHVKFHELFIRTGSIDASFGKDLNKVELVRGRCDYTPFIPISKEFAVELLEIAEKFVDELHKVIKEIRT
jgi:uncharacterized protein (UPF0332 family)